ncbi:MAG: hypothetical protein ACR2GX_05430 [Candidatus Dormibacteria bacterium]
MEPSQLAATAQSPHEVVAHIDQKALRLSALLREIDNHPLHLGAELTDRVDEILEMLACRIAATRALLQQQEAQELEGVAAGTG